MERLVRKRATGCCWLCLENGRLVCGLELGEVINSLKSDFIKLCLYRFISSPDSLLALTNFPDVILSSFGKK